MFYKEIILAALLTVTVAGCAAAPVETVHSDQLERRVAEQKRRLDAANDRIDELGVKLQLLQEKLLPGIGAGVVYEPEAPPENLKVVKLSGPVSKVKVLKAAKGQVRVLEASKKGANKYVLKKSVKKKSRAAKPLGPKRLYSKGQNLFLEGRYASAREVFSLFTDSYPKHSLADNALYWLGEAHYSEQEYKSALASFLKVTELYPNENKAPDAMLKVGLSYMELEEYGSASRTFNRLVSSYPDSVAAGKADRTLKTLLSPKKDGSK